MTGIILINLGITTNCHAQATDTQNVRVEATIGPWDVSSNNQGNGAGTKEKPTIAIPPSDSGSSANLPQTGVKKQGHILAIGLLLSIFSVVMFVTVNREKDSWVKVGIAIRTK
ncbi:LPXTG cell wall anchor domain-containing protein [Enterococcus durans]|uniref:LPXTG cell wall anchor domain-containing protein n=1 Tax=Enterococcus durans TaxID=53345 RepID=A0A5N0Z0H3_9ENTE|nr:LPXTG cell wall anchor domain-containing protein [Enterococcus durans]TKN17112.1 LPXTG cell wall anchor domain-containing protein [Enterococcus sp. VV15]KAA9187016.1 LPXTG cell wall anchor domain-containing protein [Enterococcus durans]KAA9187152.1 LPXTG cell wall anchor domain-containing protein [Enterococcus durans]KAA9192998.1 LPXTG cell wall anchor domain-containing protein [Enterococcus durans]